MCILQTFAQGLVNPAEKDFADFTASEYQSEAKTSGGFAKKSPAFQDRTLPTPQKSNTIRQVSVNESDPFLAAPPPEGLPQEVSQQSPVMQASPVFGGEMPAGTAANNFALMQNNIVPYNASIAAGYAMPYGNMQQPFDMQQYAAQQYGTQQYGYSAMDYAQLAQQQFAQQQMMQYPQQYTPEYANMYANTNPYSQYGSIADPSGMTGYPAESPQGYQQMPDYSSVYQALLQQGMALREAEANKTNVADQDKKQETDEAKKQAESNWTLNNLVPVRVSSPLGETLLMGAKTISPFCSPTGPDKGVGMPLVNKSWLDHPWYFGGFVGSMHGSELVSKMIDQKSGGNGGFIVGYNFNEYWGLESRLHFASMDIADTDYAIQTRAELYPDVVFLPTTRSNKLTILDASVHYYPLGNAKWRPFFKYGLGIGQQRFADTFGYKQTADVITMPLGVGMRYWWNERIAIQADLVDNVIFSSGVTKTQNNFTFAVGLTYSFGTGNKKHPVHYWPATPSMGSKW